jgi:hypothetical protein
MTKIIDLTNVYHQAVKRPALKHGRTRWTKDIHQVGLKQGCRKHGRNFSKVIGNPNLRTAGAGVIWTTV